MSYCVLAGKSLSPEIASCCNHCSLFINTCLPLINDNGYVVGTECDYGEFCYDCPYDEECDKWKGEAYVITTT